MILQEQDGSTQDIPLYSVVLDRSLVLERFNTAEAGKPVKEILLKLNLPDHRSILTDSKVTPTKHGRMTKPYSSSRFIANYFIADSHKDGHGVKEPQERCNIKAFKLSYLEKYEHVGLKVMSSQDGKVYKMAKRDYTWLMISSDSIIPLGQKNTLAEYVILSSADNHPPMLENDLYDSWKSRMELYMQNREHGRMILESVENGPLIWPTVEENRATNIILQGLPADIYSLQERECKLYDAFDKFTHIKGESLHTYYLRFTQLINDMNIYKMKMEQFQVNTKFLNSLPPEWSKFVTDVKLVKDLHTSNFDQLHAYLEQHELHANEVRIMRERNQDPLAFVANQ
ncbi:hypothetical protein Tco_0981989 [Tanacetum coccineum]